MTEDTMEQNRAKGGKYGPFLAGILLIGLALRLVGIQFGAPLTVHPDEHNLLFHAMEAGAQQGNPEWFEYPSGMLYLTLATQGVRYLLSDAESASAYWSEFVEDPFPYHLWIRVLVAGFGVLGILALFLLGREWSFGRPEMSFLGLGSAFLLAVHFLHVRDSHFATVDIPLTTAITLVLWLMLREIHLPHTNIKRLLLIALAVGACCGIKYTAAPLLFPLIYLAVSNVVRGEDLQIDVYWFLGSGASLLVAVGLGFLITTPYAILDSKKFWEDIAYQWFTSKSQAAIYGGGEPFLLGYLSGPWMWSGGRVLGIFAFFGFMMAVLRGEREDRLLLWFAIPYFLLISIGERVWGRWFLPLVPLQLLWTVRFVASYVHHPFLVSALNPFLRQFLFWVVVSSFAISTLVPSLRLLVLLRETDTRALALAEMEDSLTQGDYVLTTGFTPPLPKEIPRIREDRLLNDRKSFEQKELHRVEMTPLEELIDKGINKVAYSSFYWDAARQPHVQKAYDGSTTYNDFLEDLTIQGREVWEVSPSTAGIDFHPENIYAPTFQLWRWTRPGPDVRLYDLPGTVKK